MFKLNDKFVTFADRGKFYELIDSSMTKTVKKKKELYLNIPASFDIETTSFYDGDEKRAIMYIWQFGIDGNVIIGRTWGEYQQLINELESRYLDNCKLLVYVHNLAFEFQFMRKFFKWDKVFAIDNRTPIYARSGNVEYRCSYLLSGYSLKKLGDELTKYKVSKLVGDLDYEKPRSSITPMTDKEIGYCINDVLVVMAYIQECIENDGNITKIPLTKTGYVRNLCRKNCLRYDGRRNLNYIQMIQELNIGSMDEFNSLRRAFQGGFTHANINYVGKVMKDVGSYDFTSSYPTVMLAEKFPMTKGCKVNVSSWEQFEEFCSNCCVIFDVRFTNIYPTNSFDNPISYSKCWGVKGEVVNNGRIVSADELITTITNVDFGVYKQFYHWDKMEVSNVWVYGADYLPREIVLTILDLYGKKTTLKGVEGKEIEYLQSKAMLNSIYGMAVMNPLRDEYTYENGVWGLVNKTEEELSNLLYKENTNPQRFLFYPWGVFVTAYARRNLFSGILAFGIDYIYSDTDSIKAVNIDSHKEYIDAYNEVITKKLETMGARYHINPERFHPKTIKGVKKPLGVWDFEGIYSAFKTLGAKRYMVVKEGALKVGGKAYNASLTVSGLNKFYAIPYLFKLCKGDVNKVLAKFDNFLYIPANASGRLIHTYIDDEQRGKITDYLGNVADYDSPSGVHLEKSDYNLSLSLLFVNYMQTFREVIS